MWRSLLGGFQGPLTVLSTAMLIALAGVVAPSWAGPLTKADEILVIKHERKLYLRRHGETLKSFPIALGWRPVGPKIALGDGRTPEGLYRIVGREARRDFYRALRLSYPNSTDRERAKRIGVNPGGGIMIHAVPQGYEPTGPGVPMIDWTDGCIAVTNADMDEIWDRVADGIPVEIQP